MNKFAILGGRFKSFFGPSNRTNDHDEFGEELNLVWL